MESKKKKGFIQRVMEKLDKKLEEKAKATPCCDKNKKTGGGSCC